MWNCLIIALETPIKMCVKQLSWNKRWIVCLFFFLFFILCRMQKSVEGVKVYRELISCRSSRVLFNSGVINILGRSNADSLNQSASRRSDMYFDSSFFLQTSFERRAGQVINNKKTGILACLFGDIFASFLLRFSSLKIKWNREHLDEMVHPRTEIPPVYSSPLCQ